MLFRKGVIKAYNRALKDLAKLREGQPEGAAAVKPDGASAKA
jgi:hypothetical protein